MRVGRDLRDLTRVFPPWRGRGSKDLGVSTMRGALQTWAQPRVEHSPTETKLSTCSIKMPFARMKLAMNFLQVRAIEMGVDLSGGQIGMAEHFLHRAQVRAAFQQVGGERMANGVRRGGFGDAGRLQMAAQDLPHAHARELAAARIDKDFFLQASPNQLRPGVREILLQPPDRHFADGYQPFLLAFAKDTHQLLRQEEIIHFQFDCLRNARAGSIQKLQQGAIAHAQHRTNLRLLQQLFEIGDFQHLRNLLALARQRDGLRRIVIAVFLADEIAVKHANGGKLPADAGGGKPQLRQLGEQCADVGGGDLVGGGETAAGEERRIAAQIKTVGDDRIVGEVFLGAQIVEKFCEVNSQRCVQCR